MQPEDNSRARLLAATALIVGGLAFVAVLATSLGSGEPDEGAAVEATEEERGGGDGQAGHVRRALERGVYVVRDGDTLVSIADSVDMPVTDLQELNPDLDPFALRVGEKVRLR